MRSKRLLISASCLLQFSFAYSQRIDTSIFTAPIVMDTVVINAIEAGWDLNAFILKMKRDTTFYRAFKNIRFANYNQTTNLFSYNEDGQKIDSLHLSRKQVYKNKCRTTQIINQASNKHFYKRDGSYRYYTASLFDYVFFNTKTVCNEIDGSVVNIANAKQRSYLEKSKDQLKQLLFNPGTDVKSIPFIGNKARIFDAEEINKYEFSLSSGWLNEEACWIFSIKPKSAYKEDLIYNSIKTWFRKSDDAILKRQYALSYSTWFYQFDVTMMVNTISIGNKLFPSYIHYKGNWHIFGKDAERISCTSALQYP